MNADLRKLADEFFEHLLETQPSNAHMLGDYRYMDRVEDASRAGEDAVIAALRGFSARAKAFDPDELDGPGKITRETLIYECDTTIRVTEMRQAEFGVDPIFGPQAVFQVAIPQMSVETAEHADKMLAKYSAIAGMIDQTTERLREGIANGRVNADFAVTKTVEQLDAMLGAPAEDSAFLTAQIPSEFSEEDTAAWRAKAVDIVTSQIFPAFERYRDVIRDEVGPVARSDEEAGLKYLPDGDLVYMRLIEKYTTLPMQAEEIHEIGLQQIEKLNQEYLKVAEKKKNTFQIWAAHQLKGMIALQEKDYKVAADVLKMANVQNPYNLYRIALAYDGLGDKASAKEYCKKAAHHNTLNSMQYAFMRHKAEKMLQTL